MTWSEAIATLGVVGLFGLLVWTSHRENMARYALLQKTVELEEILKDAPKQVSVGKKCIARGVIRKVAPPVTLEDENV